MKNTQAQRGLKPLKVHTLILLHLAVFLAGWSHIKEEDVFYVWRGMSDFRQIMYNGRFFTPDDFNRNSSGTATR